jgi:hypothetical protein
MQVGKDVTTQSEEAVECNINEPIEQHTSKGDTLDVDTLMLNQLNRLSNKIESFYMSACKLLMYVVCTKTNFNG